MWGLGQNNLCPNFSFEQRDSCPTVGDQIQFALDWVKISEVNTTPDYYNICSLSSSMGVPKSFLLYQEDSRNCGAYSGLVSWVYTGNSDREHIGVSLTQPLVIGQKYFLSFKTVLGGANDGFYYFDTPANNIGMRLSTVAYSTSNPAPIDNFAHLRATSIISDTANWVRISGSIIADSAYNFLMLGNFYDDANTDTITLNCGNCINNYSYFLIDDVCVSTDSTLCNGGIDALPCTVSIKENSFINSISIFPNPANNFVAISSDLQNAFDIELYNTVGLLLYAEENLNTNNLKLDISQYNNGLLFIKIKSQNNQLMYKLLKQ